MRYHGCQTDLEKAGLKIHDMIVKIKAMKVGIQKEGGIVGMIDDIDLFFLFLDENIELRILCQNGFDVFQIMVYSDM